MKKTTITIMTVICIVSFTITSAYAGSSKRRRHHLEGFIIGTSAGFLGAAIINKLHHDRPIAYAYEPNHRKQYKKRHHPRRHDRYCNNRHRYGKSGHWEIKRRWVPAEYEKRWNPGHYNKRGRWVEGRYERFVVTEGYWKEKRVWIRCY
ncbi:MAG: hypothetical protein K8R67_16880 [Desulfobacteraceae bacterium]|nr:hypothetical protein [Desulfobacteraceae bacterium]